MYFSNKVDRRSGTSSGSSPRPATLSRVLPDIPKQHSLDRGHHTGLPDIPTAADSHHKGGHSTLPDIPTHSKNHTNSPERQKKAGHSHSQLPEIPVTSHSKTSPVIHRSNGAVSVVNSRPKTHVESSTEMDDYDHIEEATKKKVRPRSDYDHVVIEGGEKKIVLAKSKMNENDYAEVQSNDTYEQVPQDVTVIPISKPSATSQTKSPKKLLTNPVHKTNSFDDPYNKITEDDMPYNKIKDDGPYNKVKENEKPYNKFKDDPYNKIKVDDPYNFVKEDLDELDPYNTVNDGSNSARSSGRKKPRTTSFKGPVYDPYASVVDEERNVSNQTDPYARVGDTESELEDPYNKVVDENDSITNVKTIPEYGDDDYATVNKAGEVEYAKVNKGGNVNKSVTEEVAETPPSPREEIIQDEYATVVKVRKLSAGTAGVNPSVGASAASGSTSVTVRASVAQAGENATTPPEPPRDYDESRDTDGDHYNTVALVSRNDSASEQGKAGLMIMC